MLIVGAVSSYKAGSLESQPWYWGDVPQEAATAALEGFVVGFVFHVTFNILNIHSKPDGSYLVRYRAKDNNYAVCIKTDGQMASTVITFNSEGRLSLGGYTITFASVFEFIAHFRLNMLKIGVTKPTSLLNPVTKKK